MHANFPLCQLIKPQVQVNSMNHWPSVDCALCHRHCQGCLLVNFMYLFNCVNVVVVVFSVGGWPISQPPRAEAFSRASAQPVSTQRCVRVCVSDCRHTAEVSAYACAYACVVSSLCPVYFSSPATLRLRPEHWSSRLNQPIQAWSQ